MCYAVQFGSLLLCGGEGRQMIGWSETGGRRASGFRLLMRLLVD